MAAIAIGIGIYRPCTYNRKRCRCVWNYYYYDCAVHISVAIDMHTLLDRNHFSSSSNGWQHIGYVHVHAYVAILWLTAMAMQCWW